MMESNPSFFSKQPKKRYMNITQNAFFMRFFDFFCVSIKKKESELSPNIHKM